MILFVMMLLGICLAWNTGQTVDETYYNGGGYAMVRYQDYRIQGEHPPLMMQLGSLPLLLLQPDFPIHDLVYLKDNPSEPDLSRTGVRFLYESGNDPRMILFLERIPILLLTLFLGWLLFIWARDLYGGPAALIPLLLFAISPNMLAHGTLFTTDMGVTVFYFAFSWSLYRLYANRSLRAILLSGLFAGLALMSKMSAILLLPVSLMFWAIIGRDSKDDDFLSGGLANRRFRSALGILALFLFANAAGLKFACIALGPLCLIAVQIIEWPGWFMKLRFSSRLRTVLIGAGWFLCLLYAVKIFKKYELFLALGGLGWVAAAAGFALFLSRKKTKSRFQSLIAGFLLVWFTAALVIICGYTDSFRYFFRFRPFGHFVRTFSLAMTHASSKHQTCLPGSFVSCDSSYFADLMAIKTPVVTLLLGLAGIVLFIFKRRPAAVKAAVILPPAVFFLVASFVNQVNIGLRHILPVYPFLFLFAGGVYPAVKNITSRVVRRMLLACLAAALLFTLVRNLSWHPHYLAYFNEAVGSAEKGASLVSDSNISWGQDNRRLAFWARENGVENLKIAGISMNADEYNYYGMKWEGISEEDFLHPRAGYYALDLSVYAKLRGTGSWFADRKPDETVGRTFYVFHVR